MHTTDADIRRAIADHPDLVSPEIRAWMVDRMADMWPEQPSGPPADLTESDDSRQTGLVMAQVKARSPCPSPGGASEAADRQARG